MTAAALPEDDPSMANDDSTVGIHTGLVTEWFRAHIEGAAPPLSFEIIKSRVDIRT